MNKTYIKGKELALEDSIHNMQNLLKRLNIEIIEQKAKNPAKNIYSILIYAKGFKNELYSNGKGSSYLAAKASALGEFCERLLNKFFFNDYYIGKSKKDYLFFKDEKYFSFKDDVLPKGILNEELLSFYNESRELEPLHLMDFNFFDLKKGIVALPFIEEFSKERLYFPINLLNNLYVSNGMATGNSLDEAKVQALCEIYERYVKFEVFKNSYTLPKIDKSSIKSIKIKEIINSLEEKGLKTVILDASLGGVFPVVAVLLIDKNAKALASFGSHPNFEIALERTLTEAMQGRGLEGLNDLSYLTLNKESVANNSNLEEHFINSTGLIHLELLGEESNFTLSNWNFEGTINEELAYLLNIAKEQGFRVYSYEVFKEEISVCRIVIPKVSEIYEVDELIYNNSNTGAFFREVILNLKDLKDSELVELLDNLEAFEVDNTLNISKFIGVFLNNKITIAELKLYINLALQEYESAKELLSQILFFNDKKLYRLIESVLEIKINNLDFNSYKESLKLLYGEDCFNEALDIVNAKSRLFKIGINSRKYKKIIKLYGNIL